MISFIAPRAGLFAVTLIVVSTLPAEVQIAFSSNPSRVGDAVDIAVSGLNPSQSVRLEATRLADEERGNVFRSQAEFVADVRGEVHLSRQAPSSGDWNGIDRWGPFWSMQRQDDGATDGLAPDTVRYRVIDPDSGETLAEAGLDRRISLVETEEISLDEDFQGAFIQQPINEDGPLPVLILLGGSEGNDRGSRAMAPYFAARGYAAVGLPYYSPAWGDQPQQFPNLPRGFVDIPVDRIARLIEHLETIDGLDIHRIALFGVSKGAEMALIAGTRIEGINAIAAIVPADVVWEGWGGGPGVTPSSFSWGGDALPFVPYEGMQRVFLPDDNPDKITMAQAHSDGRVAHPDRIEAARIAVEEIDVPVFVAGGGEDTVWPSAAMALNIARTRQAAGKPTTALVFADAGHSLSSPPDRPASEADARARSEIWPSLLSFLEDNLEP